ncbi:uncharacterized protein Z518_00127 [Rhinocladiella mackenziei CBS 650.93]|uniref:Uncharacterized protein n=1 Tax=Rhinocladiella mackenziei CBS 650.93 TaxID=1442369 RepID=A0A0D2ISV3_9EURO|nr:uncharacterized protein Z518_00127 [Rhinocladiella mackenziei CBS 650.93]KIX09049.1 hypothetical protein Z518_00127 [Rhinocladiella mackenziei CBS 650.93]
MPKVNRLKHLSPSLLIVLSRLAFPVLRQRGRPVGRCWNAPQRLLVATFGCTHLVDTQPYLTPTLDGLFVLGASHRSTAWKISARKILKLLHRRMGHCAVLPCWYRELSRRCRDENISRCFRGSCYSWLAFFTSQVVLWTNSQLKSANMIQWYTKEEQALRSGIWFSFNGVFQLVGGFLAYGIVKAVARYGNPVAAWRVLFLCTGLLTVLPGVDFYVLMPDSQLNARFLSERDRALAVHRIQVNQQGIGNKHFKRYQLIETLLDPRT